MHSDPGHAAVSNVVDDTRLSACIQTLAMLLSLMWWMTLGCLHAFRPWPCCNDHCLLVTFIANSAGLDVQSAGCSSLSSYVKTVAPQ